MVTDTLQSVKKQIDAFVADEATDRLERSVVADTLVGLFACYLEAEDPRDDTEALLQHTLEAAAVVGGPTRLADRSLVQRVEFRIRRLLDAQAMLPLLDELVGALEVELQFGVDSARERLVELCGNGRWSEPNIFTHHDAQIALVELAARHRNVAALESALTPARTGHVAARERNRTVHDHALDLLGYLAADPRNPDGSAAQARAALIRLADDLNIGSDASLRLPAHLMSYSDRAELCSVYESRFERLREEGWDPDLDPDCRAMAATLFACADVAHAS
jgi:hypothetical protein